SNQTGAFRVLRMSGEEPLQLFDLPRTEVALQARDQVVVQGIGIDHPLRRQCALEPFAVESRQAIVAHAYCWQRPLFGVDTRIRQQKGLQLALLLRTEPTLQPIEQPSLVVAMVDARLQITRSSCPM